MNTATFSRHVTIWVEIRKFRRLQRFRASCVFLVLNLLYSIVEFFSFIVILKSFYFSPANNVYIICFQGGILFLQKYKQWSVCYDAQYDYLVSCHINIMVNIVFLLIFIYFGKYDNHVSIYKKIGKGEQITQKWNKKIRTAVVVPLTLCFHLPLFWFFFQTYNIYDKCVILKYLLSDILI